MTKTGVLSYIMLSLGETTKLSKEPAVSLLGEVT